MNRGATWGLRSVPLHPLLVAAYPILFLFGHNIADQVTLAPLWGPLAVALGGAAAVMIMLAILLRNVTRAALLTSLVGALFFSYGHAWNGLADWLGDQTLLLAAYGFVLAAGALVIVRGGRWLRPASELANLLALAAVAVSVAGIGSYVLGGAGLVRAGQETPSAAIELATDRRPDVYYLVFDRYAGTAALAETYGHDNAPFLEALEARGFYVARESHANYIKTPLSLVSTLEMDYLDPAPLVAAAASGADRGPIQSRLRERLAVPAALSAIGYAYVHVANWWEPTATNVDADRVLRYEGETEFEAALVQTTLLRVLGGPADAPEDPWDWRTLRAHSEYELERLEEIPRLPGPKFVFAHLLLPHDPYVFDRDGSFMDKAEVAAIGDREAYVRQLEYLNGRILDIVDGILAASDEPPVILLQADEGPFPERYAADEWGFAWTDASDAELEQKFGILNAYHIPGAEPAAAGLHPGVTPVNSFRIVFNEIFGADLPLLPDRVYAHPHLSRFYEFVDITDRLAAGSAAH